MKVQNYKFKANSDWEFLIDGDFQDYLIYCTASYKGFKIHGQIKIEPGNLLISFPKEETNVLTGIWKYDVEINKGELGNLNALNFYSKTIQRGDIEII